MPDRKLRSWWCDGFIPEEYELSGPTPRISGRAWICKGQRQEKRSFTLFLNEPGASRDLIAWGGHLPPLSKTCWIAFDDKAKLLQIEPSAATPDLT
jgi:hypothetical protein